MGASSSRSSVTKRTPDEFVNHLATIRNGRGDTFVPHERFITPIQYQVINKEWWWTADVNHPEPNWMPCWFQQVRGGEWDGQVPARCNLTILGKLSAGDAPIPTKYRFENGVPQPNNSRYYFPASKLLPRCAKSDENTLEELARTVHRSLHQFSEQQARTQRALCIADVPQVKLLANTETKTPNKSMIINKNEITSWPSIVQQAHTFSKLNLQEVKSLDVKDVADNILELSMIGQYAKNKVQKTKGGDRGVRVGQACLSLPGSKLIDATTRKMGECNVLSLRYDANFSKLVDEGEERMASFCQQVLAKVTEFSESQSMISCLGERGFKGVVVEPGSTIIHLVFEAVCIGITLFAHILEMLNLPLPPKVNRFVDNMLHSLKFGAEVALFVCTVCLISSISIPTTCVLSPILGGLAFVGHLLWQSSSQPNKQTHKHQ